MYPNDKIPLDLKQNTIYILLCPEERCSQSYTDKLKRCLENRVKEHTSHVSSAICIWSDSNNISHIKVLD